MSTVRLERIEGEPPAPARRRRTRSHPESFEVTLLVQPGERLHERLALLPRDGRPERVRQLADAGILAEEALAGAGVRAEVNRLLNDLRQDKDERDAANDELREDHLNRLADEVVGEIRELTAVQRALSHSTHAGLPYQAAVFAEVSDMVAAAGDTPLPTGEAEGRGGRKGDVVAEISEVAARGRKLSLILEARRAGRNKLNPLTVRQEVAQSLRTRGAQAAIVVTQPPGLPRGVGHLKLERRLYVVAYDPEKPEWAERGRVMLGLIYGVLRATVLEDALAEGQSELAAGAISRLVTELEGLLPDVEQAMRTNHDVRQALDGQHQLLGMLLTRFRNLLGQIGGLLGPEIARANET